jgi:small subunit ribosomal protein S8
MTNDLVSDMLTRVRNATLARQSFTRVQYSKLNLAILKVLAAEGYITSYAVEQGQIRPTGIKVLLKYKGWWIKKPLFSMIRRVSKPGQRVFSGYKHFNENIDGLRYNQGIAIISTSVGVVSHAKATKLKKGGEILCYVG